MNRLSIAIACCVALSACGVDGEPEAPEPLPAEPQPRVSGAVTITDGGVYPTIGVSQGWWSIYVGRGWWY